MADEEAIRAMLEAERQWRADMLALSNQQLGYLQAIAESHHAGLAALAEIRALLVVSGDDDENGPGEEISIAEILETLTEDVGEMGHAANLLAPDEADG